VLVLTVTKSPFGAEPEPGTIFKVNGSEPQVLGRSSKSAVRVKNRQVSRKHLMFLPKDNGWHIMDLGSKNGTSFNGTPLKVEIKLKAGDRFRIGQFLFWVTEVSPPKLKKTAVAAEWAETEDPESGSMTDAEETCMIDEFEDI
jgi:pSer/pThr/pTyr-binding forkhead associated (FHA) protein